MRTAGDGAHGLCLRLEFGTIGPNGIKDTSIATREDITDRYASHLLPLAFDIVEAITVGLTVEALVRRIDLPLGWDEQKALLGFA